MDSVDWTNVAKQSLKSIIKKACDLWNNNYLVKDIAKELGIAGATVVKHLKKGVAAELCNYNSKDSVKRSSSMHEHAPTNARKCVCTTTKELFNSLKDASVYYSIHHSCIHRCCNNGRPSAGKCSDTNERLKWGYYDENKHKDYKLVVV